LYFVCARDKSHVFVPHKYLLNKSFFAGFGSFQPSTAPAAWHIA
jgi:hypothetical protein